MPKQSKLTPAEWEVMNSVWELKRPVSVRDVLEHAFPKGEKAYTTVQTVMNTLEKKKLLRRAKTGLVNFYSARRSKEQMIRAEISSMASRICGGSIPALANSLLSLEDLNLKEIELIKALLDEKEKNLKGGGP